MNDHVIPNANKERSYDGDYKKLGDLAEEIIMAFLSERPDVVGIEDFRELRAVHESDIDIAIKTIDGRVTLAEIKYDYHLGVSGNVLFEVLRINHTCIPERCCTLGWSARSPAIYFLLYAPQSMKIYQCRVIEYRKVLQTYTRTARKKTHFVWVDTDRIKSTVSILIPWDYCKDIFTIHDVTSITQRFTPKDPESELRELGEQLSLI